MRSLESYGVKCRFLWNRLNEPQERETHPCSSTSAWATRGEVRWPSSVYAPLLAFETPQPSVCGSETQRTSARCLYATLRSAASARAASAAQRLVGRTRQTCAVVPALGAANELGAPAGHVSLADAGSSQHGSLRRGVSSAAGGRHRIGRRETRREGWWRGEPPDASIPPISRGFSPLCHLSICAPRTPPLRRVRICRPPMCSAPPTPPPLPLPPPRTPLGPLPPDLDLGESGAFPLCALAARHGERPCVEPRGARVEGGAGLSRVHVHLLAHPLEARVRL